MKQKRVKNVLGLLVNGIAYNVEVFVSGGHKYTLKLTASCPPACTNTVLAAVYYE